jgi:multisubunit Na+/H+ antiporter MnhE subunit
VTTLTRQAERSWPVELLGRVGMVCYGAVHVLVAYLAVRVATGTGTQRADQRGALKEVASTSFGGVVLWVLAIGLLAFALWQLLLAAVGFTWRTKQRTRTVKRLGAAVRAVTGVVLAVLAINLATGDGGSDSGQDQQTFTARLLELPAGRLLVGVVALIVLGFAVGAIVSGVRRSFMRDLNTAELPSGTQRWVRWLGMIGYLAKGVAVGIVGVLIGIAALQRNPGKAGGLDAALHTLVRQPLGPYLLIAVAAGLAAFGIYCLAAARSHRA